MNRLSTQAIDELYTACKQDAQDIAIRDISGRMFLSGPQAETLQEAAALPAGDVYLTLTVELFGPYDSAAAFARDCYTLTALAKQCTVPPEKSVLYMGCPQPGGKQPEHRQSAVYRGLLAGPERRCAAGLDRAADGAANRDRVSAGRREYPRRGRMKNTAAQLCGGIFCNAAERINKNRPEVLRLQGG